MTATAQASNHGGVRVRDSTQRYEPVVHRRRDAVVHCQRTPFVICIFKAANDRMRRAHQLGRLLLGQTGSGAQIVNFACHIIVGLGLLKLSASGRFADVKFLVDDYRGIGGDFLLFSHSDSSA